MVGLHSLFTNIMAMGPEVSEITSIIALAILGSGLIECVIRWISMVRQLPGKPARLPVVYRQPRSLSRRAVRRRDR
jgi:hypothetical protein